MGVFDRILGPEEAGRVERVMRRLRRAGLNAFALTGGLALELQLGPAAERRPLRDLDLVVPCLEAFPPGTDAGLIVNHLHADAPPGRLLVQLVDPAERLRLDVFGAVGGSLRRASRLDSWLGVIAKEDLLARIVRSLVGLANGEAPAKLEGDFRRLLAATGPSGAQAAWLDHRPDGAPEAFPDAVKLVKSLMDAHPERLVAETYAQRRAVCARCSTDRRFPLASEERVFAALGYV